MSLIPIKAPPKKILEKHVEDAVVRYARRLGVLVYKFSSPSKRSVPDRLVLFPQGVTVFIEFKRPGAKATKAQSREIEKIKTLAHHTYVCDNIEVGKRLVYEILNYVSQS